MRFQWGLLVLLRVWGLSWSIVFHHHFSVIGACLWSWTSQSHPILELSNQQKQHFFQRETLLVLNFPKGPFCTRNVQNGTWHFLDPMGFQWGMFALLKVWDFCWRSFFLHQFISRGRSARAWWLGNVGIGNILTSTSFKNLLPLENFCFQEIVYLHSLWSTNKASDAMGFCFSGLLIFHVDTQTKRKATFLRKSNEVFFFFLAS